MAAMAPRRIGKQDRRWILAAPASVIIMKPTTDGTLFGVLPNGEKIIVRDKPGSGPTIEVQDKDGVPIEKTRIGKKESDDTEDDRSEEQERSSD
jgi:hypothetical protein